MQRMPPPPCLVEGKCVEHDGSSRALRWVCALLPVLALTGEPGCSIRGNAPDSADGLPAEPSAALAPSPKVTGCAVIQDRADDAGCRVDVSCTDGGLATFACVFDTDGGARCGCGDGEATFKRFSSDATVCAHDAGPTAASELCGWEVQP